MTPDDVDYLDSESINGLNLYCYCYNDPVNRFDPSGHIPEWLSTTLKIVGGVAIIAGCVVGSIFTGGALSAVLAGAAGAAVGEIVGYYAGPLAASLLASGGGLSLVGATTAGLTMSGAMAANIVVGSLVLSTAGALVASGLLMFAKTSRQPGKVTSSDKPSWVNESMVDPSKTPQQNATNILNWKYDPGNWPKGPGTEYNKIVKWIERYLRYYRGW